MAGPSTSDAAPTGTIKLTGRLKDNADGLGTGMCPNSGATTGGSGGILFLNLAFLALLKAKGLP